MEHLIEQGKGYSRDGFVVDDSDEESSSCGAKRKTYDVEEDDLEDEEDDLLDESSSVDDMLEEFVAANRTKHLAMDDLFDLYFQHVVKSQLDPSHARRCTDKTSGEYEVVSQNCENVLKERINSMSHGIAQSEAWKPNVLKAINTFPFLQWEEITKDPAVICEACKRKGRIASQNNELAGVPCKPQAYIENAKLLLDQGWEQYNGILYTEHFFTLDDVPLAHQCDFVVGWQCCARISAYHGLFHLLTHFTLSILALVRSLETTYSRTRTMRHGRVITIKPTKSRLLELVMESSKRGKIVTDWHTMYDCLTDEPVKPYIKHENTNGDDYSSDLDGYDSGVYLDE